jgi:predicted dehydrogenase
MNRRGFLKSAAAVGTGWIILPSGTRTGAGAQSNKLNVALIGVWGRGTDHYRVLANENVVALCDVNEKRLTEALKVFPGAKTYWDWRKCIDQKPLDAVVICTADHHHGFIGNWALNRGLSVYTEKPLGISVEEVRTIRANYIKQRNKVATQHGTQRHAFPNFERLRELILDGAIGELKTVSAWDSRQNGRPGYPAKQGEPPAYFHYDQWIGPSPMHPYSPQYFAAGSPGMNCLAWNPYRDFGVGQMGDMGAHTMDLVWNCIDAGTPIAAEVDQEVSDKYDPDINPVKLKVTFEQEKNSWRGPITVTWYQGGLKPPSPRNSINVSAIGNGAIFEGTKGVIVADFNSRMIIPNNDDGDMTYYRRRPKEELLPLVGGTGDVGRGAGPGGGGGRAGAAPRAGGAPGGGRGGGMMGETGPDGFPIVALLDDGAPPDIGNPSGYTAPVQPAAAGELVFQREWLDACKGLNNRKTHCDFDYAGTMMEEMLLGLVAHRAGKRIAYDPATGRVTNAPEANDYLKRQYRQGWTLNG